MRSSGKIDKKSDRNCKLVRVSARDSVQQVTCRTSPTGECGKLLAVPERGQASCLSRCWFNTSKIFNFLKMLAREISTTCRSPSKWKSWLKTLLWLSHLCFFSGKALLQNNLNIYPGEGEMLRAEKIACFVKQLETRVLLIWQLQLFTSIFWVGQNMNTPHGQSVEENNFKKIPQCRSGSWHAMGWRSFQSKGSYW